MRGATFLLLALCSLTVCGSTAAGEELAAHDAPPPPSESRGLDGEFFVGPLANPWAADCDDASAVPTRLVACEAAPPARVFVAPYVWVPAMFGTTTVLGTTSDVDVSLGEAFSLLGDVKGAAQGHVEIGRGDWTLLLDGMILRIADTVDLTNAKVDADVSSTFFEVVGARRLNAGVLESLAERGVTVEALGGVRYYQVSVGLTTDPFNPVLPTIPREQTEEWVDLLVGARTSVPLTENLTGILRGDFAGFGIGTSSTFTWNLVAGVEYRRSSACEWAAGYRILDINEEQSSAGGKFEYDVTLRGPFLAILFRY